jgi:hypothetical protein
VVTLPAVTLKGGGVIDPPEGHDYGRLVITGVGQATRKSRSPRLSCRRP